MIIALLYLYGWCLFCLLVSCVHGVLLCFTVSFPLPCFFQSFCRVCVLRSIIPIYSSLAIVDDHPLSPDRPLAGTNITNTANITFCVFFFFFFLHGVSFRCRPGACPLTKPQTIRIMSVHCLSTLAKKYLLGGGINRE